LIALPAQENSKIILMPGPLRGASVYAKHGRRLCVYESIRIVETRRRLIAAFTAMMVFVSHTTDLFFEIGEIDKLVGLAAQLVRDHRGLRVHSGHDADPLAFLLKRLNERAEIAIA
jgi:hypothetical protein